MLAQALKLEATSAFTVNAIIHKQEVANQYSKILSSILSSYFNQQVKVEYRDQQEIENLENISWLCFGYKGHKFSIGLERDWSSAAGLQSLLEWLHSDAPKTKVNFVDTLSLEGGTQIQSESNILQFYCNSNNHNFLTWLSIESGCQFPQSLKTSSNQIEISQNCYIDLGSGKVVGKLSILDPKLIIFPSILASGVSPALCATLNSSGEKQILRLKEDVMSENVRIKTMLRLGALELGLDDFLSLKSGSEITFSLHENTSVELELGGHIVGRGELKRGENGFILGIIEAFNNTTY